jgi:hypothetical protein
MLLCYSAIFCDFNFSDYGTVFFPYDSPDCFHSFRNCTFKNINSTGEYSPAIRIFYAECPVFILNCVFDNLKSNSSSIGSGAIYLNMYDIHSYVFSENTISNIISTKSAIVLTGYVDDLSFEDNIFENIESSSYGGVLYVFILFLFLFNFYKGVFVGCAKTFSVCCFKNCTALEGFIFYFFY